jgi:WD40 repeat protein
VGDAWAGKTALLAEAVAALPAEVDAVVYFASRRETDADGDRFLAAVVPQLEYLLDEDPGLADQHRLRSLWNRAVDRASAFDRPLLLAVDGLDEDLHPPGTPIIARLLPVHLGDRGHVLVTSRPFLDELAADLDDSYPLRTANPVPLSPSEEAGQLATLATQELRDLLRSERAELAVEVLGVLAAAGGPLSVADVAALTDDIAPVSPASLFRVRNLMVGQGARTLQPVGPTDRRYTFAHDELLKQAQANADLAHPEFRRRIHRWAQRWAQAGWPLPAGREDTTPRYLLDTYPATLIDDQDRLCRLAGDISWVTAALHTVGVDRVLAALLPVAARPEVVALVAALRTQAANLRPPHPVDVPAHLLRQLCLGAVELGQDGLAAAIRTRLQALPTPGPVPEWSTRRVSPALVAEFDQPGGVGALAVAADGRVVSGGLAGRLQTWDPDAPATPASEIGRSAEPFWAVAVVKDGRVVTGGWEQPVRLWGRDARSGEPVVLGHHARAVTAAAALPDGRAITGADDTRMLIWNPATPGAEPIELGRHHGVVHAVTPASDGRVMSGGDDTRVLIWNLATPGAEPIEIGRHKHTVHAIAAAPGRRVVSGGWDRRVLMWDPDAPGGEPIELGRHDGRVDAVTVTAGGRVVSGGWDERVLMWDPDAPGGEPIELGRHDGPVVAVSVTPGGLVVSGGNDGRVLVWDPDAPGAASIAPGRSGGKVEAVTTAPDGRVIMGTQSGQLLIWNPACPGAPLTELGRHDGGVYAVAVAADGRVVTGGGAGRVWSWQPEARHGTPTDVGRHDAGAADDRGFVLVFDWVFALGVFPDGRVISGAGDGRVLVWDAPGAEPVELGRHDGQVAAIAVTPGGRVVTGGRDGRLLVWNPEARGVEPVDLGRHVGPVAAVAVAPDGRVITGEADGRVLIWDPADPAAPSSELGRHARAVEAVTVAPDGRVISAGGDGRVLIWDPGTPGASVEIACAATSAACTGRHGGEQLHVVLAHRGHGLSMWTLSAPQRDDDP